MGETLRGVQVPGLRGGRVCPFAALVELPGISGRVEVFSMFLPCKRAVH